ncbi:MAG: methyltransferase domain-containing protein [Geobacteraceae bacterium]|nr:methyltransferase domain-containing protein [Geobacteraceae bacterium]
MDVRINRDEVGRAFHLQAGEYDRHATVQKRVVDRLMELAHSHVDSAPATVLDIGCGTGQLLAALGRSFPKTGLYGLDLAYNMTRCSSDRLGSGAILVNGDAEHLPFRDGAFDLVVSTSTLQWVENLDEFFRQCHRVLDPAGLLCIAFFGGRTMQELQECYREAVLARREVCAGGYLDRLHRFKEIPAVQEALGRSSFSSVLLFSEIEMDYYPDVHNLLRSIKRIGAGASAQEVRPGGLGWRSVLNETSRHYRERYGKDGMIPVTYEVVYLVAQRRDRL